MAMAADGGSTASAVIYQEVKAWIAQQEAFEAQHNKPAPLTDVQRMALQDLRLPTATPSPTPPSLSPAVAVSTVVNYVGLLTEYYQKRQGLDGLHWEEDTSRILAGGVTGRVCRVTIVDSLAHKSGHIEHFPAEGYGLNNDGSEPCFTNKKAAKHFAAKCAVEWLVAQGFMRSHILATTAPPPNATPHANPAVQITDIIDSPLKSQTKQEIRAEKVFPDVATATSSSLRATEVAANLCHDLLFPTPRYKLVEKAPNVYSGMARFDDYGRSELIALAGASLVEGMEGKEATRQAVAAKLVEELQFIEAGRDAQLQLVMARLNDES